jgi:hypothetical protein
LADHRIDRVHVGGNGLAMVFWVAFRGRQDEPAIDVGAAIIRHGLHALMFGMAVEQLIVLIVIGARFLSGPPSLTSCQVVTYHRQAL